MTIAQWETIDSDWVSRVSLRFDLSALVTVPDEADREGESSKYGTLLITITSLELYLGIAPLKMTLLMDNKQVFETFIPQLPLDHSINAQIDFLTAQPLNLKCSLSDISGTLEHGFTLNAPIPSQPACEAIVFPRYHNCLDVLNKRGTIIGNINIEQQWLEISTFNNTTQEDRSFHQTLPRLTRECLKLIPLPSTIQPQTTHLQPLLTRTLDEMLEEYIELFACLSDSVRSSPNVIEPYIHIWDILGNRINSLLSWLNPVRWLFGESADSVNVRASLMPNDLVSPRRFDTCMFLLVELLSEGEVLHAVKSRSLSSNVESFLDLPCDGEMIRLTLLEEDAEISPRSPSRSRVGSLSPNRYGQSGSFRISPSGTRNCPRSATGSARLVEQIDINRREMRQSPARFNLCGGRASICNVRLATSVSRRVEWMSEILPTCVSTGDRLVGFMLEWIRSGSNDGLYPIGVVVLLDRSMTTLFDVLRTEVELQDPRSDPINHVFRNLHEIPSLCATGLFELQHPWLSTNQIHEYNICGNHQKSILFHSYLHDKAGHPMTALCLLHSSEIEFMVLFDERIWSVQRNKTWRLDDPAGSVKCILTVIFEDNIYLNLNRRSKVSECMESLRGELKGHWCPLFRAQDSLYKQLLHERLASSKRSRLVLN